ncbi:MAG: thiamine ABC transporter substrate-binding protein [Acidimicrobiia bacterium]|nr:thiamine ABC transporter substrate-binding protein [Acidimicrobiia bacterium]
MKHTLKVLLVMAILAAACGGTDDGTPAATGGAEAPNSLVLMTHDSFDISEETLALFTDKTGIEVNILRAGDAGAMVNQAILTKDNPTADVLFGIDNTFLTRAVSVGLFLEYESPLLADVPDELEAHPQVTPMDFGDVCVNFDRSAFRDQGLLPPSSLADLTKPEYHAMLVVQDPATSSPGLAFLLATIAAFPEDSAYSWKDYWSELRDNEVEVAAGWEEAYYGSFSGGAGEGRRPLVVSYASSPPAEVVFAEEPLEEAPTAVIPSGCFRQVEYAGILTGTAYPLEAAQLVDFMLSVDFQQDMPLHMFVFPANERAQIPDVFLDNTIVPSESATIDPAVIDENRDRWIDEWTEIVSR